MWLGPVKLKDKSNFRGVTCPSPGFVAIWFLFALLTFYFISLLIVIV